MLRQILGKNIIERDADWLKLKSQNKKVIVDLGCGDGLYAYRQALQKPDNLYLAIDANSQVLQKLSNKVEHQKLGNLIYLQHTAESLPLELNSKVDQLMILYPWGSLLKIVATAETELQTVFKILKIHLHTNKFNNRQAFLPTCTRPKQSRDKCTSAPCT